VTVDADAGTSRQIGGTPPPPPAGAGSSSIPAPNTFARPDTLTVVSTPHDVEEVAGAPDGIRDGSGRDVTVAPPQAAEASIKTRPAPASFIRRTFTQNRNEGMCRPTHAVREANSIQAGTRSGCV
jgi:hypothetical protein